MVHGGGGGGWKSQNLILAILCVCVCVCYGEITDLVLALSKCRSSYIFIQTYSKLQLICYLLDKNITTSTFG